MRTIVEGGSPLLTQTMVTLHKRLQTTLIQCTYGLEGDQRLKVRGQHTLVRSRYTLGSERSIFGEV